MNLLAIDTSSENISLSVMRKGKICVDFNQRVKFGASLITPLIEKSLKEASLSLDKIDAFVVGAGPGSFTGLRISFSIVKAFTCAIGKPLIKIGSFLSVAYPYKDKHEKIAVISDARRSLIYAASFKVKRDNLKMEGKEKLVNLDDFIKEKKDYFFITYDEHIREQVLKLNPKIDFYSKKVWPKASYLLELARDYYKKSEFTSLNRFEPLYLHPKTCQIRKKV
jgi:tRNA threonylcarbamoyladenosine biosynthesis protein TsaB